MDEELIKKARSSLEAMANCCSVDMALWDEHANAVLALASRLEERGREGAETGEPEYTSNDLATSEGWIQHGEIIFRRREGAWRPTREEIAFIIYADGDRDLVSASFSGPPKMGWDEICAWCEAHPKSWHCDINRALTKADAILVLNPPAPPEGASE